MKKQISNSSSFETAIKVRNLSKCYRIGQKEQINDTFVQAIANMIKSPLKNMNRLKRLTHFDDTNENSKDIIWAIKNVSFEVKKGEVIGIIGENGAGKSTLLKILAQITHPSKGRVELNGRVASLLEVGTGFHPELSGRENIYLNGTILGMTKKEVDYKLDKIVEFSGVEKFLDTPVKRYSSGMRVRLAFSVAAHLDPEILLIDEVLAVGDAKFQKKCLGKMEEVSKSGRTVLFVSHNMSSVNSLCERAIVLKKGAKVFEGNSNDSIEYYLDNLEPKSKTNLKTQLKNQGLKEIEFSDIYINDHNGKRKTRIPYDQYFYINVDFEFKLNNKDFYMVLWVGNKRYDTIFWTADCDLKSSPIEGVGKGHYRYSVRMPKCFFKPGTYTITLCLRKRMYSTNDDFVRFDNVVSFDIIDFHMRDGKYATSAIVAPEIDWNLETI